MATLAWLTGVFTFLVALVKFWQKVIQPKLIAPVKAHFELVHESARSVKESKLELDKIRAELTQNGGKSLKDIVLQLHKDLQASGLSLSRLQGLVQAILSASKEGVWLADEHGAVLWVNGWFAENIGWMPHEMEGAGWKNTIHPDCRAIVFQEWEACIRERRDFIMELDYTTKGGDKVRVNVRCTPMRQNAGNLIIGHVGFVQSET